MPTHQYDIPALPVLLPLGLALMLAVVLFLRLRGLLTPARVALGWFAGWYAVAVLGATLLPMHLAWGGDYDPDQYRFIFIPLLEMRPLDFVLNTIMTLPLAGLLFLLFGIREERRLVRIGFLVSLAIETTQLVMLFTLDGNRWADVNDLTSNTLGTWLGYLAFRRLMRYEHFRRAVGSCSFARTARTGRETPAAAR